MNRSSNTPASAIETSLSGWGNYARARCSLYRPEDAGRVRQALAVRDSASYIARGCGRSYGDSAVNEGGGVLLLTGQSRFLDFDEKSGVLESESGATIADIFEHLLPRGWFVHTTPGTRHVTLGGAIAADVHGKNHHFDGSFAAGVLSFELLLADGSVVHCSRDENSDIFWATLGGMGLTGVILRVRLQLRRVPSAYVKCRYVKCSDIDAALAEMEAADEGYRYSVAWIDCLTSGRSQGRSLLMLANDATPDKLPERAASSPLRLRKKTKKSVPPWTPDGLVNRFSVAAFNALYYHSHADGVRAVDYDTFFYPLDAIHAWNRLYGSRGFIQYQVLFPQETARAGLRATLDIMNRSGAVSFLCVLKRCGPASGGLLSFLYPGFTLAMDIPNQGERTLRLLAELERVTLEFAGRIYLAKDATTPPQVVARMYPALESFRQLKRRIDPGHLFQSSQSRRLGITP